jgi:DNA polymerase-3 subunit beta
LLCKEEGQLKLSATDLTLGVTVWMNAVMDGDFGLTLPAKTLTDVVNTLSEPEIVFSVNGKPEAALKCGTYKGTVKGIVASEFPPLPSYDFSGGVTLNAAIFKEMIQKVAFAASLDEARPVLTGVLVSMDGNTASMVATDGFRLAKFTADLPGFPANKQLILPAPALKEVVRILSATKSDQLIFLVPNTGSQAVLRCDNVQIVSQLIDGKFPDFQAIIPKGYKTRTILPVVELLKACKQAGIIAREGNNVVHFHLVPGADNTGKLRLLAQSDETGATEIELAATVEGQELEIAFNVKFLQEGLEAIAGGNVVIETNTHNTPAVIRAAKQEGYLYVLMPMHLDGK